MTTTRTALALAFTLSATLASGCVIEKSRSGSGGDVYRAPRTSTTEVVVVEEEAPMDEVEIHVIVGCSSSLDCAWDEICDYDGACVADEFCYSDSDCYGGEHCGLDGLCYEDDWCYEDYECGPGFACYDDACWPEEVTYYGCADDFDCPSGSYCTFDALCEALPCYEDFDCGPGAFCDLDDYCTDY